MRLTLQVKLALGLAAIVTAIMGVSVLLLTMSTRSRLMENYRDSAIQTTDVAMAGLENAMIVQDPARIVSVLQTISRREGFSGVFVVSKRGEIKYSADATDVGRVFAIDDPSCLVCHNHRMTDEPQTIILPSKNGARILRVAAPMLNQPSCQGCHQERMLGMLIADLSLAEPDRQVAATQRKLCL